MQGAKNIVDSGYFLAALTCVGAMGGFPQPPDFYIRATRNESFHYAVQLPIQTTLLAILVYQGGGKQNAKLSAMVAVGVVLFVEMIKAAERCQSCKNDKATADQLEAEQHGQEHYDNGI